MRKLELYTQDKPTSKTNANNQKPIADRSSTASQKVDQDLQKASYFRNPEDLNPNPQLN